MPNAVREHQTQSKSSSQKPKKVAVLIDGSALFSSSRAVDGGLKGADERRLNYLALLEVLVSHVEGLTPPTTGDDSSVWTMWTSANPSNEGQSKFLDFAQQRLKWQVRRVLPREALTIEPSSLFVPGDASTTILRLARFDASIAFAIGRLADTHRIVVVSDSYSLAEPLKRVNEHVGAELGKPYLAFFGHSLERRWLAAIRGEFGPGFVDLDDYESELFGIDKKKEVAQPEVKTSKMYF